MKAYRSLLLLSVLAFVTLANGLLPLDNADAFTRLAAATKTRTKKPTPTAAQFGSSTSNRRAPNDVKSDIEEVAYFGMGGGNGEEDPCQGITRPTIVSDWFDVEQLQYVWVHSCGWKVNKQVEAVISKPDGDSETISLQVSSDSRFGAIYLTYQPSAFDPPGKYKVHFSNGEQTLNSEFNVSEITQPGAALIYSDREIQIYNFQPYEKVRLFRYVYIYADGEDKLLLQEWQEFAAAADGDLRITLADDMIGTYAVVGEKSGEFHVNEGSTDGFGESILKANNPAVSNKSLCKGAPKSRVAVGSAAHVTFTDGTPTRIRKRPGTDAKVIGRLPEGTRFLIVGEHKCRDGYTWWNIELPNGTRGWMAEGKGSEYYLEPMSYSQQTCSYPHSRLAVGRKARVAEVDGTNMRIRSQPGFSQSVVTKVPEGTLLTILKGPRCVDGSNWWYIRTQDGTEGWMTETQNDVYLITPIY